MRVHYNLQDYQVLVMINSSPAASKARVIKQKDGRLAITVVYVNPPKEKATYYIGSKDTLFGISYEQWHQSIGNTIKLWEWEGTGPGMIGSYQKRKVSCWLGGKLEFPMSMSDDEIKSAINQLLENIHGEFYEYTKDGRQQAAWSIKQARSVMMFRKKFKEEFN